MDDKYVFRIWVVVAVMVVNFIWAVAAYDIVDRVGPARPIVTMTQQYQAK